MATKLTRFLERIGFRKMQEQLIDRSVVVLTQTNCDEEGNPISETLYLRDGSTIVIPLYKRPIA
jgi:hypothetical protein